MASPGARFAGPAACIHGAGMRGSPAVPAPTTMNALTLSPFLFILAAAPHSDETLAFSVEVGTTLTKTFTSTLELELDELELALTVDGEDHELEAPEVSMTISETEAITFTDEHLAVDDGRTTKVKRKFDALAETSGRASTDPEGESSEESEEGESELEGHSVVLTRDADDEVWAAEYAEGDEDGDPELLAELEHHADLVDFLPAGDVAVGAEWSVPVAAFLHLSSPSGELHIETPSDAEDDDEGYSEQFEENLAGEITATLDRVEDGVAYVALTFDLTSEVELEGSEEVEEGMTVETSRKLDFEFELEGTLAWHLEQGRAVSCDAEGAVGFDSIQRNTSEQGGASVVFTQTQRFKGTLKLTAAIE